MFTKFAYILRKKVVIIEYARWFKYVNTIKMCWFCIHFCWQSIIKKSIFDLMFKLTATLQKIIFL